MPTIQESPCPDCGASPGCLTVELPMLACSVCGLLLGGVLNADGRYMSFPYADFAGTYDTKSHFLWPCGCLINDADAHRVGCPGHPQGRRGDR